MLYNGMEYPSVLETPVKIRLEAIIVEKILSLLNDKKYNSINEFFSKNESFAQFVENNNLRTLISHFNELTDDDYNKIKGNVTTFVNGITGTQEFIPIKDLIGNIDNLSKEAREAIMEVVNKVDNVDGVKINLAKGLYVTGDGVPKQIYESETLVSPTGDKKGQQMVLSTGHSLAGDSLGEGND